VLQGTLQFAGLAINPISYMCLVISIGLLVDFLMHVILRYYESTESTRDAKVKDTLRTMGASILVGGLSTCLGTVPLAFASSEILRTVFVCFVALVSLGVSHGLILMPVLLSYCGPEVCVRMNYNKVATEIHTDEPLAIPGSQTPAMSTMEESEEAEEKAHYSPLESARVPMQQNTVATELHLDEPVALGRPQTPAMSVKEELEEADAKVNCAPQVSACVAMHQNKVATELNIDEPLAIGRSQVPAISTMEELEGAEAEVICGPQSSPVRIVTTAGDYTSLTIETPAIGRRDDDRPTSPRGSQDAAAAAILAFMDDVKMGGVVREERPDSQSSVASSVNAASDDDDDLLSLPDNSCPGFPSNESSSPHLDLDPSDSISV
jgi:Patched family